MSELLLCNPVLGGRNGEYNNGRATEAFFKAGFWGGNHMGCGAVRERERKSFGRDNIAWYRYDTRIYGTGMSMGCVHMFTRVPYCLYGGYMDEARRDVGERGGRAVFLSFFLPFFSSFLLSFLLPLLSPSHFEHETASEGRVRIQMS